ncbi:MAG: histidinol dehydrogenase [Deltaproteobacteria bacterium]|nr:histidinol dehydrogenase [Deltaproteobacteria bacterium]
MRRGTVEREGAAVLARRELSPAGVGAVVSEIIASVAARGDRAVREYTHRFDGVDVPVARVAQDELVALAETVPEALVGTMVHAAENIAAFHGPQRPRPFTLAGGHLRQRIIPLDVVGCYVPGGRAAYPSTVLMNVVPARVAGVRRICVVTPPGKDGRINPAIAAAALVAGATDVFRVGGAQAVAALAFGTETLPRVDKITGPGNAYVAEAKRQVAQRVGVDIHAGPSEVLVLADESADPWRVACDLIAQAEHDPLAIPLCVTTSRRVFDDLSEAVERELARFPNPVAVEALEKNGWILLAANADAAVAFVNRYAPEHLQLEADPGLVDRITAAGSIFAGGFSPEPVGDYFAGPNHTLPTGGCARFQSALGTADFVRRVQVIAHDAEWLFREGAGVVEFARAEGLPGHARAVEVRLSDAAAGGGIARTAADWVIPEVRGLKAYTLTAPPDAPAKLNQNEAPDDLPAEVKQRILDRALALDWRRYPPFDDVEMRELIARRDGWKPEGVLIGNGSNEILSTLVQATVGFGERVAIPDPCFSLYPLLLGARGADIVRIPLSRQDDFAFSLDACLSAIRSSKVAILTSPNNPTGSVLHPGVLRVLKTQSDALLVVDEAYREWCGQDFSVFLESGRVVLLRTFSKALAMAGLRFGYLLGPPALCQELRKLLLPYNVNAFTRAAVSVLLEAPDLVAARVEHVTSERARLAAALRAGGRHVVEGGANFLLFSTDDPAGEFRRLLAAGVLVRDLSSTVPGFLRVSIGSRAEDDLFLSTIGGAT